MLPACSGTRAAARPRRRFPFSQPLAGQCGFPVQRAPGPFGGASRSSTCRGSSPRRSSCLVAIHAPALDLLSPGARFRAAARIRRRAGALDRRLRTRRGSKRSCSEAGAGLSAAGGGAAAGARALHRRRGAAKPWTALTYAFLHGSWAHVLLNSVWLAAFGTPVARRCGGLRFLLLGALCAVGGAVAHVVVHPLSVAPDGRRLGGRLGLDGGRGAVRLRAGTGRVARLAGSAKPTSGRGRASASSSRNRARRDVPRGLVRDQPPLRARRRAARRDRRLRSPGRRISAASSSGCCCFPGSTAASRARMACAMRRRRSHAVAHLPAPRDALPPWSIEAPPSAPGARRKR